MAKVMVVGDSREKNDQIAEALRKLGHEVILAEAKPERTIGLLEDNFSCIVPFIPAADKLLEICPDCKGKKRHYGPPYTLPCRTCEGLGVIAKPCVPKEG
jgi:DNA-binding response OmpR family regulator